MMDQNHPTTDEVAEIQLDRMLAFIASSREISDVHLADLNQESRVQFQQLAIRLGSPALRTLQERNDNASDLRSQVFRDAASIFEDED
jgi:hypothetical protein